MKKILAFFAILGILGGLLPAVKADEVSVGKRKLLVTAYYSPQPDQRFYIRGSFEADKVLNGNGTNGADGTQVFVGMLAAPKIYPFGTRVLVPGLGVGEVHDRGGAIIPYADYDRIDVWMGRGEEGLARAINWGARLVEGEVYDASVEIAVNLDFTGVSPELSERLIARLQNQLALSQSYAYFKPVEEATPEELKDLQVSLTLFGNYNGPIDGELSEATEEAIIRFQLDEGLIDDRQDAGAGNFGPATRARLQERVANYDVEREKQAKAIVAHRALLSAGMGKNASGEQVAALQQLLWELGYYHGPVSQRYDSQTIDAVFAFQQGQGLIHSAYDEGAGYYGHRTHEAMVAALDERLEVMKDYPKELQTWIPVEIPLPKLEELTPASAMAEPATLRFELVFEGEEATQFEFTEDLEMGDRGEAVKALQEFLIREGYLDAGLSTGTFGNQTQAVLAQFQEDNGLPAIGRLGPKTRQVLNGILN